MHFNIDEFKKKFPNLAKEIFGEENSGLTIKIIISKEGINDPWRGYLPGPIDYIRRCKSIDEALEVINYLEKYGEITSDEAKKYREVLNRYGLEYFGPKKSDDYYYKKAMEYWRKQRKARKVNNSNEKL